MSAALREVTTDHEWLPQRCPKWCSNDHAEVLVELGNDVSSWHAAQEHCGPQFESALWELRNPGGGYNLRTGVTRYAISCRQRPVHANGVKSEAEVVHLEVQGADELAGSSIDLLPSEARTLAARLIRLADVMELEA